MMKKQISIRYRWNWRKCLVNIMVFVVIIGGFTVYISQSVKAVPEKHVVTVMVQPGDTLWSLAENYAPNSDQRETVYAIQQLNHMERAELKVGEKIKVEIEE